jgi:hypothetical protein
MAADHNHLACPSAIVNAPIDVVWGLLMNTAGWGQFYDLRVMSVEPPGPAAPSQRLIGVPGRGLLPFRITFDFTDVDRSAIVSVSTGALVEGGRGMGTVKANQRTQYEIS